MSSNIEWTRSQELALVKELSKRKHLQLAWLPLSARHPPRFGPALDNDGQRKFGKDFLKTISEAVFGQEDARDIDVIRTKLTHLYREYFGELQFLDSMATPDQHAIPWGKLPINKYQQRRKHLTATCPWWEIMHAMMVERREVASSLSAINTSAADNEGHAMNQTETSTTFDGSFLDGLPPDVSISQPTASCSKKNVRALKAHASALKIQNNQLRMELELQKSKVEILSLQEEVRTLKAKVLSDAQQPAVGVQERSPERPERQPHRPASNQKPPSQSTSKGKEPEHRKYDDGDADDAIKVEDRAKESSSQRKRFRRSPPGKPPKRLWRVGQPLRRPPDFEQD